MNRRKRTLIWHYYNAGMYLLVLFMLGSLVRSEYMMLTILAVVFIKGATSRQTIKGKLNPNVYDFHPDL